MLLWCVYDVLQLCVLKLFWLPMQLLLKYAYAPYLFVMLPFPRRVYIYHLI